MSTLAKPAGLQVDLPLDAIAEICRRWRIRRLEVFGSALHKDFRPDSDVDLLYTWEDDASWGWEIVRLREELKEAIGRPVDLVSRWAIEHSRNNLRKQAILSNVAIIYES
jgi:uncharacterized protein